MTDISYDEAVRTLMRQHKVDEPTAALMVADVYPALSAFDPDSEPAIAFDNPDNLGVPAVYHPPSPAGRVIPVDDEPSPAWALEAQKARTQAQLDGDHYRNMSRRTSMHTVDD